MEKDRRDNGVQRVCSRDTAEKAIPQRQENEVIGAVVVRTEKGWRDDSVIHMRYGEGDSEQGFRNGSELREMLPLWKGAGEATPSRRPVERVRRKITYRNGRESREMLPLWKGARRGNAVQKACRKGAAENNVPQRQRIAGNAAVVKGGRRDNGVQRVCSRDTAEKAIPQRQRNVEFAAIVDGVVVDGVRG